jgi:hypothetical protein
MSGRLSIVIHVSEEATSITLQGFDVILLPVQVGQLWLGQRLGQFWLGRISWLQRRLGLGLRLGQVESRMRCAGRQQCIRWRKNDCDQDQRKQDETLKAARGGSLLCQTNYVAQAKNACP